jgi:uncharacterized membrane protein required for colicin V production
VNYIDLAIIILVALCAFAGYRQGLIRTVYRLVSFFIALFLANALYPHIARLMRDSFIFTGIQNSIKTGLNLEGFVTEYAAEQQASIIDTLPLPAALRVMLQNNFSPDVHGILRVETIEDYISAFFANIAINGIAIVGVFLFVLVFLTAVGAVLDIIGKLPVIRTFNNWGGLIFGCIMGAGISWISVIVLSMFFATSTNPEFYELLQGSFFASRVLDSMLPSLTAVN